MILKRGHVCGKDVYSPFNRCEEHCKYKDEYNNLDMIINLISEYDEKCLKYISNPYDDLIKFLEKKKKDTSNIQPYTIKNLGKINYKDIYTDVYLPIGCEEIDDTSYAYYVERIKNWRNTKFPYTEYQKIDDLYITHKKTIENIKTCLQLREDTQFFFIDVEDPRFKLLPKNVKDNIIKHITRIQVTKHHLDSCTATFEKTKELYDLYTKEFKNYKIYIEDKKQDQLRDEYYEYLDKQYENYANLRKMQEEDAKELEEYEKRQQQIRIEGQIEQKKKSQERKRDREREQKEREQKIKEEGEKMMNEMYEKNLKREATKNQEIENIIKKSEEISEYIYKETKNFADKIPEDITLLMKIIASPKIKKIFYKSGVKVILQIDPNDVKSTRITTLKDSIQYVDGSDSMEFVSVFNHILRQFCNALKDDYEKLYVKLLNIIHDINEVENINEYYKQIIYDMLGTKYGGREQYFSEYIYYLEKYIKEKCSGKTDIIDVTYFKECIVQFYENMVDKYIKLNEKPTYQREDFINIVFSMIFMHVFLSTLYKLRKDDPCIQSLVFYENSDDFIKKFYYLIIQYETIY
jgi:hypothetical protein